MLLIAIKKFRDLAAGTIREEGDVFEVEPDRYAEIMAKRGDLVKPFEDSEDQPTGEAEGAPEDEATGESADSVKKPAPKRKTSKAKSAK